MAGVVGGDEIVEICMVSTGVVERSLLVGGKNSYQLEQVKLMAWLCCCMLRQVSTGIGEWVQLQVWKTSYQLSLAIPSWVGAVSTS